MVFLCAHTADGLRPETFSALMSLIPQEETLRFHDVDGDDFAYGKILADLWSKGDDLAIVEQDVVVRPDVVKAFKECPMTYCVFPYAMTTDVMPGLGCTRWHAEFIAEHPDAMERALECPGGYGQGHYKSIDVCLMRYVLARNGFQPHVHLPPVQHLNEKQALINGATSTPLLEVPLW